MEKLYKLLAKKPLKGDVGIEIECEGKGFHEVNTEVWRCEDDGSLRGRYPESRIEYILNKPIPVESVKHALTSLNEELVDANPVFSFRTSVHVHVNVLHMDEEQIISFIYTYLLLEEALFHYCGASRKCNRFCLRLQDADSIVTDLNKVFSLHSLEYIRGKREDDIRYAAMNLAAIAKYGSIEFRGMRGTLDVNTIDTWCNALISIRNFSCHYENCLDIHDLFVTKGPKDFLSLVLGELSSAFMYKNMVQDMQRSYSLAIDLPHTYHQYKKPAAANVVEKKQKQINADQMDAKILAMNKADVLHFGGVMLDAQAVFIGVRNQLPIPAPIEDGYF